MRALALLLLVAGLVASQSAAGSASPLLKRPSPDKRWVVVYSRANGYGRLDLVSERTGQRSRMYRSNDSCCDEITWVAPHTLVFVDDYRVETLDPGSRRIQQIAGFSAFAVAPNGRWVAGYADTGGHAAESVDVAPLGGGPCLSIPRRPDQDDAYPSFSRDSTTVYVERRHFSVKLGYDTGPSKTVAFRLARLPTVPHC